MAGDDERDVAGRDIGGGARRIPVGLMLDQAEVAQQRRARPELGTKAARRRAAGRNAAAPRRLQRGEIGAGLAAADDLRDDRQGRGAPPRCCIICCMSNLW
jgi:hypothetical protein